MTNFARFDLGVHTGSTPRLARFIESTAIGANAALDKAKGKA